MPAQWSVKGPRILQDRPAGEDSMLSLYEKILAAFVIFTAIGLFGEVASRRVRLVMSGKPENRFDAIPTRVINAIVNVIGQIKVMRNPVPGVAHAFVFWGFCV